MALPLENEHPGPVDDRTDDVVDASYYGRALRRGWIVIAASLACGLALGAAFLQLAPHQYTSTTTVLVSATRVSEATEATGARTTDSVNLDTEAQLVTSEAVVAQVVSDAGGGIDPDAVVDHVSVEVPANTTLLQISFAASTPERAQQGARAFADAYLAERARAAQAQLDQTLESLATQLTSVQDQVDSLNARLIGVDAVQAIRINTRLRGLDAQVTELVAASAAARSVLVEPGEVVHDAPLPTAASSPDRVLVLGSAAALGLLVGLCAALYAERFRPRLHTEADVERELGIPLLGDALGDGRHPVEDPAAFARVHRRLQASGARRVLVAGVGEQSGALAAAGLTRELLAQGRSVEIVVEGGPLVVEPGQFRSLRGGSAVTVLEPGQATTTGRRPAKLVRIVVAAPGDAAAVRLTEPGDPALLALHRRSRADVAVALRRGLESLDLTVIGAVRTGRAAPAPGSDDDGATTRPADLDDPAPVDPPDAVPAADSTAPTADLPAVLAARGAGRSES